MGYGIVKYFNESLYIKKYCNTQAWTEMWNKTFDYPVEFLEIVSSFDDDELVKIEIDGRVAFEFNLYELSKLLNSYNRLSDFITYDKYNDYKIKVKLENQFGQNIKIYMKAKCNNNYNKLNNILITYREEL